MYIKFNSNLISILTGITLDDNPVQHSFAGDQIVIQIIGIDMNNVSTGSMICDIERPVKVTSVFEARLVIFSVPIPITRGFPVILHCQSVCEQATIKTIISQLNRSTGEIIKKKPRYLFIFKFLVMLFLFSCKFTCTEGLFDSY